MKTAAAVVATLLIVAACGSGPTGTGTPTGGTSQPTASPTRTAALTASATASPTASASASPSPAGLSELFRDDFSTADSGWGVGDVPAAGTISYGVGVLEFAPSGTSSSLWSRRDFPAGAFPAARVEADIQVNTAGIAGLLCGTDDDWLFGIVLGTDGDWFAVEIASVADGGELTILEQGALPDETFDEQLPLALAVECSVEAGQLRLSAAVGDPGALVVTHESAGGPPSFDRVALYAEARSAGYVQRVDNVVAYGGQSASPSAVDQLLAHVPAEFRAGCDETPVSSAEPGALVAVACPASNPGAEIIEYVQFDGKASMDAAYQQRATAASAVPTAGDCSQGPDEDAYAIADQPAGRIFCAAQPFGIRVDWTDDRFNILTSATDFDSSYADLYDTWLEAGPNE